MSWKHEEILFFNVYWKELKLPFFIFKTENFQLSWKVHVRGVQHVLYINRIKYKPKREKTWQGGVTTTCVLGPNARIQEKYVKGKTFVSPMEEEID